ncbi:MAG: hypothetical protein JEY99_16430 [Spirochaetales bacterium]|nr:hypothetical protein [Spirochaetales bacterium]
MSKAPVLVATFIISLFLCSQAMDASEIRNILVIHSYHQGLEWTDSISEGITSVLQQPDINIHFEYLDTKRNAGEEYYQQLVIFEKQKKQMVNIDFQLIICSDNNALRFIQENRNALYPDTPVVFCGINNFEMGMIEGEEQITGVVEYIDYATTLDLIHTFHPQRDNILIILDRTPTGDAIKAELEPILEDFNDIFTFEFYQDFILADVPSRISTLGDDDVIYLLTFNQDLNGNFISYHDGIGMIKGASRVPIYGAWDFYFNRGIVGGMLTTGYAQGRAAGSLALSFLEGVPIENIEVQTFSPNQFMFDYEELDRFDISVKDLPPESLIINLPESWIEKNAKGIILFSVVVFLSLLVLFARLIQNRRNQKALKEMNENLEFRVREKTVELVEKIEQIEIKNRELNEALEQINSLRGIIPICSHCKNIRDDQGFWSKVEQYISANSEAVFSHSLCPDCLDELYPDIAKRLEKKKIEESD